MATTPAPTAPASQPGPETVAVARKRRSLAPLVIAAAVLAIGVGVVGSSTSGGAGMYNYTVAELSGRMDELAGRDIKVAGRIRAGSVRGQPASDSFRFDLEDLEGHRVAVAYTRLLPDPFEEGRDAIVQGRVEGGVLRATSLTVKCPSRYEDAESMTPEKRQRYYETDYKKHAGAKASVPASQR